MIAGQVLVWLIVAFLTLSTGLFVEVSAKAPAEEPVEWTEVILAPSCQPRVVKGTDGRNNIVYEIAVTNYKNRRVELKQLKIVSAGDPQDVFADWSGKTLERLFTRVKKPHGQTWLEPGESGVFWVNLDFDLKRKMPEALSHMIRLQEMSSASSESGAKNAPSNKRVRQYEALVLRVDPEPPVVIGPPLAGGNWLAMGGYSGKLGHRRAFMPIGNKLVNAQRYAIDWIKLDDKWRSYRASQKRAESSVSYGEPLLAVADGTVVGVISDIKDQPKPYVEGKDLRYPVGNCLTLDIGGGNFALYAHIKQGSIRVSRGDRVRRGQIIASLGNSGHSFEPHLHFHISDSPRQLAGDSVPYVIDQFSFLGEASDLERYATNKERSQPEPVSLLDKPEAMSKRLPTEGALIRFPQPTQ